MGLDAEGENEPLDPDELIEGRLEERAKWEAVRPEIAERARRWHEKYGDGFVWISFMEPQPFPFLRDPERFDSFEVAFVPLDTTGPWTTGDAFNSALNAALRSDRAFEMVVLTVHEIVMPGHDVGFGLYIVPLGEGPWFRVNPETGKIHGRPLMPGDHDKVEDYVLGLIPREESPDPDDVS